MFTIWVQNVSDKNTFIIIFIAHCYKINRQIPIDKIDAITMCREGIKSNELLIHVQQQYDYRYTVKDPDLRVIIVDTIRRLVNEQVL